MGNINKQISMQELDSICGVIADTHYGFTVSEINKFLKQCFIKELPYNEHKNKKEWLYNCFCSELNTTQNFRKVYDFIEAALNPIQYTDDSKRTFFRSICESINKVMLLIGFRVNDQGKIVEDIKANNLEEVDRRINDLKRQLYLRAIHQEVEKYCISDYLRKDYYDAVFEAAKGVAERVREMTGLKTDGGTLFDIVFSKNNPYIVLGKMETQSEMSEYLGIKELLMSIFHLVRNPAAHTPKLNWVTNEKKALDILSLISIAHKYLDECIVVQKES